MLEYLSKVKRTINSLSAIGASVSTDEHVEIVLDGLGDEYFSLITAILSRKDSYTIDELEALLTGMQERVERASKPDLSLVQTNLAQVSLNEGSCNTLPDIILCLSHNILSGSLLCVIISYID